MQHPEWILILDFGSQYTQLIARRLRELNVYCEIYSFNANLKQFQSNPPNGIILSGGPKSVNDKDAPYYNPDIDSFNVPILGICYGLQLICNRLIPGSVAKAEKREFGRAHIHLDTENELLSNVENNSVVWMSHGDSIEQLPNEFVITAHTNNAPVAAIKHKSRPVYGVQFHPEVVHTVYGSQILKNFALSICKLSGNWTASSFISQTISEIKKTVGDRHVICGLSGGVDSTVTAVLLYKAIGSQLDCVFVNNGLLRKNEYESVLSLFKKDLDLPIRGVDASDLFLSKLKGITDPEAKRKIIGNTFIEVFDNAIKHNHKVDFLAQGTLYPDVIESVSFKGPSATIKSHHNVGGLPEKMNLKLIEPMRELFKDEVRNVGRELGIPNHFINRHPFPGPGLGIRVISDITMEKLDILREVDHLFINELIRNNLYDKVWQAFAVLLPVQSVGVMGDERTYEFTAALRAVVSIDGMTADWAHLPFEFLSHVSNRIINEVRGINRVVYDISSKPPATIEWE